MEKAPNGSSPSKPKTRGKKRKRKDSDSSTLSEDALPDNVLEVEKSLVASAAKNNLDEVSVKKILKKVVTNDHVLALVKLREEEEESSTEENNLRPKLTRAKVKELMKVSPKVAAPWNLENIELTPIKHIPVKTRPEVKALIAQELPEDEDDDEYEPTNDDVPSDDDQDLESCSDLDSQPRTPATPQGLKVSPKVIKDGPFKVPQEISTPARRKLNLQEEEATIALRTRSKLSLSETPIEHIESSFVPPDELPVPPVDDHLWNDFLNECLNPASVSRNEDDDETDPEYNVAADPDAHEEDEEALESTVIKISKKELNDLVTELFSIIPEGAVEEELTSMANSVLTDHSMTETSKRWEGKQEPLSDEEGPVRISQTLTFEKRNNATSFSIGKTEPVDPGYDEVESNNNELSTPITVSEPNVVRIAVEEKYFGVATVTPLPEPPTVIKLQQVPSSNVEVVVNKDQPIFPEQIQILQQQLRQHIQLAASNFLQLYIHPLHWAMGPTYKDYLETLYKLAQTNPTSVVNVCNLKPAVDLIRTWEKTVSKETPQNREIVEFIQKESERWRRRSANNCLYIGDFHDTFKRVVANSSVFLYPYLLPPMPYRPNPCRRAAYLPAEDELIALGLDQFWDYVESNPDIYKVTVKSNPRARYGLTATVDLVCKHMFPWLAPKSLMQHIQVARRMGDKQNPIRKFFTNRTLTPVKHILLPYNPALTLYEQPEHEMPRAWVRYLAKTSKRFRGFLNQRSKLQQIPSGVEVKLGVSVEAPIKKPLHIDFTKEIRNPRVHSIPTTSVTITDKVDVHIDKPSPPLNFFQVVNTSNGLALVPITINKELKFVPEPVIMKNNCKQDSGTLHLTNTVNCNIAPISSVVEAKTSSKGGAVEAKTSSKGGSVEDTNVDNHCKCCILLRKICKSRQRTITDFFRSRNIGNKSDCTDCKQKKYPIITNRLKILVKRFKETSQYYYEEIRRKIKVMQEGESANRMKEISGTDETNLKDLVYVAAFQLKLLVRSSLARNIFIKKRVHTILSTFDLDNHDPIKLAHDLEQAFGVEMVDMNKEFVGFLTPGQAEQMNKFRDYFIQNCYEGLVEKIEEKVSDKKTRCTLLSLVKEFFSGREWNACGMCSELLSHMTEYPELARHVFSLFPHAERSGNRKAQSYQKQSEDVAMAEEGEDTRSEDMDQDSADDTLVEETQGPVDYEADHSLRNAEAESCQRQSEDVVMAEEGDDTQSEARDQDPADDTLVNESQGPVDYEADHSSSGEENISEPESECPEQKPPIIKTEIKETLIEEETIDTPELTISKTEIQNYCDSSDMSMNIVSEDEAIKLEPLEWKREEDKLILEVLKQHLTPEERLDKTILEIMEDKHILQNLADCLTNKSQHDIRERVLCILEMLVVEKN